MLSFVEVVATLTLSSRCLLFIQLGRKVGLGWNLSSGNHGMPRSIFSLAISFLLFNRFTLRARRFFCHIVVWSILVHLFTFCESFSLARDAQGRLGHPFIKARRILNTFHHNEKSNLYNHAQLATNASKLVFIWLKKYIPVNLHDTITKNIVVWIK